MIEQLLHFIANHWLLSSALVIIAILLFIEESKTKGGVDRLTPQDATQLINRERGVVVDLRDTAGFDSGHLVSALNFPHDQILNSLEKLKKYQDKPIILTDQTGQNASNIANQLRKQGYSRVYCLAGGVQGWKNAGLPVTKAKS